MEGVPPYDKSTALATLTAVMTEPLDPPKNAGGLEKVIYGLLNKDPDRRLDDAGARALLNELLNAPETAPEPAPAAARRAPWRCPRRTPRCRTRPRPPGSRALQTRGPAPVHRHHAPCAPHGRGAEAHLVIIAVIVALAILGTVLAFAFSGGDDDKKAGGSGSSASADANSGGDKGSEDKPGGASASADEASSEKGKDSGTSGSDKNDKGDAGGKGGKESGDGADDAVPDGYTRVVKKGFHFSMAMPDGWTAHDIGGYSGGKRYYGGSGLPRIQVDFNSSPKDDAVKAWEDGERASRSSMRDYQRLSIESVDWRDYVSVADWNFEQRLNGKTVRVQNRGFNADGKHGFAIVVTCEKDKWNDKECTTLRNTAFKTFRIID
ncbi:hypothetical protein NKH77_31355 [Streptomyces sp. M19]